MLEEINFSITHLGNNYISSLESYEMMCEMEILKRGKK